MPTKAVDSPLILPPVFNKMNTKAVNSVWSNALKLLRNAKHIVIVGYSLPRTDIYMQYFLKAAVGPNSNLQKITVFNPVLFRKNDDAKDMENRYQECFSQNLATYIDFRPPHIAFPEGKQDLPEYRRIAGTFDHFLTSLRNDNRSHDPMLF